MKFKNWIIKRLGGISASEHERIRAQYEAFAVKHLTGKNGEVTPDYYFYKPFYGDDILVIRSRIEIMSGVVKQVVVAPWCKEVVMSGLSRVEEAR